jgi:ABC-type nitrate/sulfonate/bicarbonate transport system substrate-binding protein
MYKIVTLLLAILVLQPGADAAEKIRIAIPRQGAQFMTYTLAHKKGFQKEEGLEAEMIRTAGSVAIAAVTS